MDAKYVIGYRQGITTCCKYYITSYVSIEGVNTNTPELKQSGHPGSGAAENSSRSNSSSQFCTTCNVIIMKYSRNKKHIYISAKTR